MAISVITIIGGDGERLMSTITDALIANEEVAFRRGMAELRKQWYLEKMRTLQVPLDITLDEGQIHEINNPRVGIISSGVSRKVTNVYERSEGKQSALSTIEMETSVRFE